MLRASGRPGRAGTRDGCSGEAFVSTCFHLLCEQFRGKPTLVAEAVCYVNAGRVSLNTHLEERTASRGELAAGRDGTSPVCQERLRIAVRCANTARAPGALGGLSARLYLCASAAGGPCEQEGCGRDPQKPSRVTGSAPWGGAAAPPALGSTALLGAIAFSRKFPL